MLWIKGLGIESQLWWCTNYPFVHKGCSVILFPQRNPVCCCGSFAAKVSRPGSKKLPGDLSQPQRCLRIHAWTLTLWQFFSSISVFGLCYVKQSNEVNIPDIRIWGPLRCQPFSPSSASAFCAQPMLGSDCVQSVVSHLLLSRVASGGAFRSKKPSLELGKLSSTEIQQSLAICCLETKSPCLLQTNACLSALAPAGNIVNHLGHPNSLQPRGCPESALPAPLWSYCSQAESTNPLIGHCT